MTSIVSFLDLERHFQDWEGTSSDPEKIKFRRRDVALIRGEQPKFTGTDEAKIRTELQDALVANTSNIGIVEEEMDSGNALPLIVRHETRQFRHCQIQSIWRSYEDRHIHHAGR